MGWIAGGTHISHTREVPVQGPWRVTERDKHQVGGQGVTGTGGGGWGGAVWGRLPAPLWSAMQPSVKVTPRPALLHVVPAASSWRYLTEPLISQKQEEP